MSHMSTIDDTMEQASRALAEMDYLAGERLCLRALAQARAAEDWSAYHRILLPLQECRRQRRMIACDAGVRTGPGDAGAGCVVLLPPATAEEARALREQAHAEAQHVEVMLVAEAGDDTWRVTSYAGPAVHAAVPAPGRGVPDVTWYLRASEALGDAAIAAVDAPLGSLDRLDALAGMLDVVVDHEKLHQRLADAARALLRHAPAAGGAA